MTKPAYKSQAARDAQQTNYGSPSYWEYLDSQAKDLAAKGMADAYTRSLSEALSGNDSL